MAVKKSKSLLKLEQLVKDFAEDQLLYAFIPDLNEALNHLEKTHTLMMGVRGPSKTPYFNGIYILAIQFSRWKDNDIKNFPVGIRRIKFLKNYAPLAVNLSKYNNGNVIGLHQQTVDSLKNIQTLDDLVNIIFAEVFYKCGLDMHDVTTRHNWELFGLAHSNPNKFFSKIYQNNKKFIVKNIDYDHNNINTFCNNVIKQEQQEQISKTSKSKSKSKSKLVQKSDKKDSNMIDDGDDDDEKKTNYDNELNANDKFGKIGDDIAQLLKQLYHVPLDVTKSILFLYLDNTMFWNIQLIEIMNFIGKARKRQQQEQLENTDKSKGKIFVMTISIYREPLVFVVDLINSTVEDLKMKIKEKTDMPYERQHLYYVNTGNESGFGQMVAKLDDENRLLSDYNIPIGATVYFATT